MILRVGIDKGCGGVLAPIFRDGSFEYIPIPEDDVNSQEIRTYSTTSGITKHPFSFYIPDKLKNKKIHFDPEFETCTYGDVTAKRNYLLKLVKDDLLVFYAGLTPYHNVNYEEALYIIGYFVVEKVIDFNHLSKTELKKSLKQCSNNAHIKRDDDLKDLVIVVGNGKNSRLLEMAILISKKKADKRGRPYHAVSDEMIRYLGIKGSIQRSIPPRIISKKENISNLKKLLAIK